ncbi:MAG: DUF4863 family protein [Nannocystaceae bacterium]|nr:DUF4863 family protein [Nannocystaceae bacterium]
MTHADPASARAALDTTLAPVLASIAALPQPSTAAEAAALQQALHERWPLAHPQIVALASALREGVAAGWLCDRGEPSARFCRLAKPSPSSFDHSLDLVALSGAGMAHAHPRGEITLALPADERDADARFDGAPAGWIVYPAGSSHTPTVTGGRMILLYALPGGAVQWSS